MFLSFVVNSSNHRHRIALLVKNSPTDARKTTLIIAPTALMDQWKLEIELKTDEGLKCLIYHGMFMRTTTHPLILPIGSGKVRSKKELLKYDVVLTTYQVRHLESHAAFIDSNDRRWLWSGQTTKQK